MTKIIGITGPAGAGKTTAARHLVLRYGFDRLRFAEGLKKMAAVFFEWYGFDEITTARLIEGDLKQTPIPDIEFVTARKIMQTLGGEWGRDAIHPDIWVNRLRSLTLETVAENVSVVVDDVRYQNEAQMIKDIGGEIWKIGGRAYTGLSKHASEDGVDIVDFHIRNDGSEEELFAQIDARILK